LSFFDVACLAAAISAQRDKTPRRTRATSRAAADTAAAADAVRYFMYVGNFTNALDSAVSPMAAGTVYAKATTALNLACTAGLLVSTLVAKDDKWVDVAAAAGGVIAITLYGLLEKLLVIIGQMLLLLLRVILMIVDAANKEARKVAYELVGIFQLFLALIVNIATTEIRLEGARFPTFRLARKPLDPERAAIHGAIQWFLGAIGYNVYTGEPLINVQP
jgi:hypothetical protein